MWGTSDNTRTAYLDTQDVARMTLSAIRKDETIGKTLTLAVRPPSPGAPARTPRDGVLEFGRRQDDGLNAPRQRSPAGAEVLHGGRGDCPLREAGQAEGEGARERQMGAQQLAPSPAVLCATRSAWRGADAGAASRSRALQVTRVPVGVLKGARGFISFFQWFGDAADRLVRAPRTGLARPPRPPSRPLGFAVPRAADAEPHSLARAGVLPGALEQRELRRADGRDVQAAGRQPGGGDDARVVPGRLLLAHPREAEGGWRAEQAARLLPVSSGRTGDRGRRLSVLRRGWRVRFVVPLSVSCRKVVVVFLCHQMRCLDEHAFVI